MILTDISIEELTDSLAHKVVELLQTEPKQAALPEINEQIYLTTNEALKFLGFKQGKLQQHLRGFKKVDGEEIPVQKLNYKQVGRRLLFKKDDLIDFVENSGQEEL